MSAKKRITRKKAALTNMRCRSLHDEREIAYHEAGHAVMAYLEGVPFKEISIVPSSTDAGRIIGRRFPKWFDPHSNSPRVKQRLRAMVRIYYAGDLAAVRAGCQPAVTFDGDYKSAIVFARLAEGTRGVRRIARLTSACYEHTKDVLDIEQNWKMVEALATVLLERKRLSSRAARKILRQTPGCSDSQTALPRPLRPFGEMTSLQS